MATPSKSRTKRSADKRFVVRAEVHNVVLAKTGSALTLVVCDRGEKLGELHVGRGSLFWRGGARKRWQRVRWARFADVLNGIAYGS